MADIITNTLQIGSNNLILQDAGARQNIATNTQDISDLKDGLTAMSTATTSDEGKALKAKTVAGGKVTEWEFGEAGGDDIDIHVDGTALVINTSVINGNEVYY